MKKILPLIALSYFLCAGTVKIKQVGQPDVYVPTMDSTNSSNLSLTGQISVKNGVTAPGNLILNAAVGSVVTLSKQLTANSGITTTSGNLTLDATTGSVVVINKTLKVDNITNIAGTANPPGMIPLGGMVTVVPALDTTNAWQPPATGVCKDGFMRADGAVVPNTGNCVGSLFVGRTLPNMGTSSGSVNRYPRGSAATSWVTGTYTTGGANTRSASVSVDNHSSLSVSIPGHYHGNDTVGKGATMVADVANYSDSRSLGSGTTVASNGHGHYVYMATGGSTISGSKTLNIGSSWTTNWCLTGLTVCSTGGSETNGLNTTANTASVVVSGTTDISHDHPAVYVTGTLGKVTGGCDGDTTGSCTSSPSISSHVVNTPLVNDEPQYLDVVYVIRVK